MRVSPCSVLRRDAGAADRGDAGAPTGGAGQAGAYDYEYRRNGTANLFMHLEPEAGRRYVDATDARTKPGTRSRVFAARMKALVDERYPDAERVRVVMD